MTLTTTVTLQINTIGLHFAATCRLCAREMQDLVFCIVRVAIDCFEAIHVLHNRNYITQREIRGLKRAKKLSESVTPEKPAKKKQKPVRKDIPILLKKAAGKIWHGGAKQAVLDALQPLTTDFLKQWNLPNPEANIPKIFNVLSKDPTLDHIFSHELHVKSPIDGIITKVFELVTMRGQQVMDQISVAKITDKVFKILEENMRSYHVDREEKKPHPVVEDFSLFEEYVEKTISRIVDFGVTEEIIEEASSKFDISKEVIHLIINFIKGSTPAALISKVNFHLKEDKHLGENFMFVLANFVAGMMIQGVIGGLLAQKLNDYEPLFKEGKHDEIKHKLLKLYRDKTTGDAHLSDAYILHFVGEMIQVIDTMILKKGKSISSYLEPKIEPHAEYGKFLYYILFVMGGLSPAIEGWINETTTSDWTAYLATSFMYDYLCDDANEFMNNKMARMLEVVPPVLERGTFDSYCETVGVLFHQLLNLKGHVRWVLGSSENMTKALKTFMLRLYESEKGNLQLVLRLIDGVLEEL